MNETQFQELFEQYGASLNGSSERTRCLRILHEHIYRYPVRRYKADPDTASEFYEFIYSKIELFFLEFDATLKISFMVFVAVRLRYYYLSFLRKKSGKGSHDEVSIDWSDEASYNIIYFSEQKENRKHENSIKRIVVNAFSVLEEDEEMPVRLYYAFPLRLSHLRYLFKRHKGISAFIEYRKYLEKIIEWEDKEKEFKDKIALKLRKIEIESQKSALSEELQQKKAELIEEYFRVNNPTSVKKISLLLKFAVSVVHRRLSKARDKIKDYLFINYNQLQIVLNKFSQAVLKSD